MYPVKQIIISTKETTNNNAKDKIRYNKYTTNYIIKKTKAQ
jgi:hypothetical protein